MGFYYDDQIKNKDNTIRLYKKDESSDKGNKPLASAIFNEDFEFEIANSWTDFSTSGNFLEGLYESVKPFSAYGNFISDQLSNVDFGKWIGGESKVADLISRGGKWVAENMRQGSNFLNNALIVQGTRFVYFSGTAINMGNMGMKFVLMYDPTSRDKPTVQDQLDDLMEYCIGDYENLAGNNDPNVSDISTFIGWQKPPGGFEMTPKNINQVMNGTLRIEFGDLYYIDNLVVTGTHLAYSRVKANRIDDGEPTSLYAEVSLAFRPAGLIVKDNLKRYNLIKSKK